MDDKVVEGLSNELCMVFETPDTPMPHGNAHTHDYASHDVLCQRLASTYLSKITRSTARSTPLKVGKEARLRRTSRPRPEPFR